MAKREKRVWRQCSNCTQFTETKREGVCNYLTEYNGNVVYVYRGFRCSNHKLPKENGDGKLHIR